MSATTDRTRGVCVTVNVETFDRGVGAVKPSDQDVGSVTRAMCRPTKSLTRTRDGRVLPSG